MRYLENDNADETAEEECQQAEVLQFDPEHYLAGMSDLDLSEDQKIELLRTIWRIMHAFVDLGLGRDSVQRILWGKQEILPSDDDDLLDCTYVPVKNIFHAAAGAEKDE